MGGTFDPAHLGHIKISKEAKKKFKLEKVYWAVTNKNPFKSKRFSSIILITHKAKNSNLTKSIIELGKKKFLINKPKFFRIEKI